MALIAMAPILYAVNSLDLPSLFASRILLESFENPLLSQREIGITNVVMLITEINRND